MAEASDKLTFKKIYQLSQISGITPYQIFYNLRQTPEKMSSQKMRAEWITLCEEEFKHSDTYEDLVALYISAPRAASLNYSSNKSDFRACELDIRILSKLTPICIEIIQNTSTNTDLNTFYVNLPQEVRHEVAVPKLTKSRQLYHETIMSTDSYTTAARAITTLKNNDAKIKDDEWEKLLQLGSSYKDMVSFCDMKTRFDEIFVSGYKKLVSMANDTKKLSKVIFKYVKNEYTKNAEAKLNQMCQDVLQKTRSIAKLQEIEDCATDPKIITAAGLKISKILSQRLKKAKVFRTTMRLLKHAPRHGEMRDNILEKAYALATNNSELSEALKELHDDDSKLRDRILKKMYQLLP
jgi:hypothetical protein